MRKTNISPQMLREKLKYEAADELGLLGRVIEGGWGALTAEETEHYIDTCRPFDKAGSYGIQEWIGYAAIERIEGSFYNVMGLPIQKVYVELDKFLDR